jgi:RNA polymerase sigma factor (sigma-70 family)
MRRQITNKEFEAALKNTENQSIIHKACKPYVKTISPDDLDSLQQRALWRALCSHDYSSKRRFTTSLYQFVLWECDSAIAEIKKRSRIPITSIDLNNIPARRRKHKEFANLYDIIDSLQERDRKLIDQYFFQRMTLSEIASINGCSKEVISQRLKKVKNKCIILADNNSK